MTDYRTLRNEERKAAIYHLAVCTLAVFDDDVLDLMGLTPTMRGMINNIRADEDDYAGCAAAFFGFMVTNYDLTDQDRLVVGQALAVASSCTLTQKVATKSVYDAADILLNQDILTSLGTWIESAPAPKILIGDAVFEQGKDLLTYMEQYNRAVLDQSQQYSKGGTNDDETAQGDKNFLEKIIDYIPFMGEK